MRHPTEGVLRRLLDEPAGVADADREHVAGCPQCLDAAGRRPRGRRPRRRGAGDRGGADVDVDAAWRACRRPRRAADGPAAAPPRARRSRAVLRRPVVAAVAVAVVLAGAGTAAANDWLQIFRTEQIAPVSISTADLVALPDLSAYGELAVTGDAGRARRSPTRRPRRRRPVSTCRR